jgi:hypothetical protein
MTKTVSATEVRRSNLLAYINEKFDGNRSAFARAADKNVNLINLVLSNNEEFRRNIGEKLARDLEQRLSLPEGWMDIQRQGGPTGRVTSFPVVRFGAADDSPEKLVLASDVVIKHLDAPTALHNVKACYMPSDDMAPTINKGDLIFVDAGVTEIGSDGVYVLVRKDEIFVRRIKRTLSGALKAVADKDPSGVEDLPGKLTVAGRVVGALRFFTP